MQPSLNQRKVGRLTIAGAAIAVAAILLTTAFAAPAAAEATDPAGTIPTPATEVSAPIEAAQAAAAETVQAPSPAPEPRAFVPTPEPVEVQEASTGSGVAAAPEQSGNASSSQAPTSSPAPVSDLTDTVVGAQSEAQAAVDKLHAAVAPTADAAVAPTAERVAPAVGRSSGLIDGVHRAATATASAIAEPVVQTAERHAPLDVAHPTLPNASAGHSLAEVAAPIREMLDPFIPAAAEELLPLAIPNISSSAAASAAGTEGTSSADSTQSFGGPMPTGPAVDQLPLILGGGSWVSPVASGPAGGSELLPGPVAAGPADPLGSSMVTISAPADVDSNGGGLPGSAPSDLPIPPSRSPGIAPGPGGSSFVPIAALLALLALAAPATFRRLGEVPAFRPPTPFVCALERPG